jgi:hypothetical protein
MIGASYNYTWSTETPNSADFIRIDSALIAARFLAN